MRPRRYGRATSKAHPRSRACEPVPPPTFNTRTAAMLLASGTMLALLDARSVAGAQTARPYVHDEHTFLLYHLDDRTGASVRDASTHARHGNLGHGVQQGVPTVTGVCGRESWFDRAVRTTAHGNNAITWVDGESGTRSFLYPRQGHAMTVEGWFKIDEADDDTGRLLLFAVRPVDAPLEAGNDYALTLLRDRTDAASASRSPIYTLVLHDSQGARVATSRTVQWTPDTWYHIALVIEADKDHSVYTLYRATLGMAQPDLLATTQGKPLVPLRSRSDRMISFMARLGEEGASVGATVDELRVSTVARNQSDLQLTLAPSTDDVIRTEASASYSDTDHPLPLVSVWNTGASQDLRDEGYTPAWQLQRIDDGHFLLPAFGTPDPSTPSANPDAEQRDDYQKSLRECARRRLPLSFPGTQWDALLTADPRYLQRRARANPNAISTHHRHQPITFVDVWKRTWGVLSPFGPVQGWKEVGRDWGSSAAMQQVQAWYPDPPKVIFISNNEAHKLWWSDAAADQHFLDRAARRGARSPDGDDTRRWFGDGWIERYRALQGAWRGALLASAHPSWGQRSIFIAYNAFGLRALGRWFGWLQYSLKTSGRADPNPLMWDGAMLDGYLMPGRSFPVGSHPYPTDYWVFSPQIEYMNDEYHRRQAMRENPKFWLELGVWNGDDEYPPREDKLASFDPPYTAERYAGMVQFGMWMLRPRVVRDFRGVKGRSHSEAYVHAVLRAVDHVHHDPVLRSFWRNSELVSNREQQHPYQVLLTPDVAMADRMFLLQAEENPPQPWTVFTEIKVFALARVQGEAPTRRWLIYAQAPRAGALTVRSHVTVSAPIASDAKHAIRIAVPASSAGSFSVLYEGRNQVIPL